MQDVPVYIVDPELKSWATPQQVEYVDAVNRHGGLRTAATALKKPYSTVWDSIRRLEAKAAAHGWAPKHGMTKPVPAPFVVKGTSSLYDRTGKLQLQWVKTKLDDEFRAEMAREAYAAMAEEVPRLPALEPPAHTLAELCTLYTMTDSHVGMMAWHKEGGDDWDLKIAEKVLTQCFERMLLSSPNSKFAVVNQLGDFLHSDGLLPVTPTSGHVLDQDGRFSQVIAVALRILRRIIDLALMKHEQVFAIMAEGNHDMASSVWLRHLFKALYENEPRLTVCDSEIPYYAYRHGKTMLGFHHGHMKKNDQLPLLFAASYPEMWGLTKKRYVHTGHRHHVEEKEHSGVTVVQHSTLAARDAHASRGGWHSERQVKAITYHDVYGEVGRVIIVPEMVGLLPT